MVHGETADIRAGIETTQSKLAVRRDITCETVETCQWPRKSSLGMWNDSGTRGKKSGVDSNLENETGAQNSRGTS